MQSSTNLSADFSLPHGVIHQNKEVIYKADIVQQSHEYYHQQLLVNGLHNGIYQL